MATLSLLPQLWADSQGARFQGFRVWTLILQSMGPDSCHPEQGAAQLARLDGHKLCHQASPAP